MTVLRIALKIDRQTDNLIPTSKLSITYCYSISLPCRSTPHILFTSQCLKEAQVPDSSLARQQLEQFCNQLRWCSSFLRPIAFSRYKTLPPPLIILQCGFQLAVNDSSRGQITSSNGVSQLRFQEPEVWEMAGKESRTKFIEMLFNSTSMFLHTPSIDVWGSA